MPKPEVWGPPTWIFLHTLVSKLKNEYFNILGKQLFFLIKRICNNLPCPECSTHATSFLMRIPENKIITKESLINTMYIFHNTVNQRKNKPQYNFEDIKIYESKNVIIEYNNFVKVFNTKGNMNMISQSFQRQILLKNIKNWIVKNIKYFDL